MEIETLVLGTLETNCYIVRDDGACMIVDIGMWPGRLIERIKELDTQIDIIAFTHGHADHIAGTEEVRKAYPDAKVYCPQADTPMLGDPDTNLSAIYLASVIISPPEVQINPGDEIRCGKSVWKVLDTSGHTTGGVSYYCAEHGIAITGDSLFAGSVGRTDFCGGDAKTLLTNIKEKLLTLPEDTAVLPGHGPASTIGQEKKSNPFLT